MRPATRQALRALGYKNYSLYLRSPHWIAKRKEYLAAGLPWQCFVCDSTEKISLHHSDYTRIGAEDVRLDLVPLCKTCHRGVHSYMKAHRVRLGQAHFAYKAWLAEGRPRKFHAKPKKRSSPKKRRRA